MRTSLAISSIVFGLVVGIVGAGGVGCGGGKAKGPTGTSAGGGAADRLPWEAKLTKGARFEMIVDPELGGDGEEAPLTVTITDVQDQGGARVYHLQWGAEVSGDNGPRQIRVEHGVVTINEAEAKAMEEPYAPPGGDTICYGEDFSNPDGCDDVCDADLCLSPTAGIISVAGLYAPGYSMYRQR